MSGTPTTPNKKSVNAKLYTTLSKQRNLPVLLVTWDTQITNPFPMIVKIASMMQIEQKIQISAKCVSQKVVIVVMFLDVELLT